MEQAMHRSEKPPDARDTEGSLLLQKSLLLGITVASVQREGLA